MATYMRCPRQYWYSYVLGIKAPPGVNLVSGLGFHKAAERGMLEKLETGEPPKAAAAQEWARDEVARLLTEPNDVPKSAHGEVTDYSVRFAKHWAQSEAKTIEPKEVETSFTVKMAGVKVVGRIDLIEKDDGVTDWKSTGKAPTVSDIVLAPQSLVYPFARPSAKKLSYRYLIGLKTRVDHQTVEVSGQTLVRAKRFAEEAVFDIAEAVRAGVFPRRTEGWHCDARYCGYYNRCFSGKDRP